MPKSSSTARVKAWRENLQRKAAWFDDIDRARRSRLEAESTFCLAQTGERKAVLEALLADHLCFRFPRVIDALGCLWRGPVPCGREMKVAEAALQAYRAEAAQVEDAA